MRKVYSTLLALIFTLVGCGSSNNGAVVTGQNNTSTVTVVSANPTTDPVPIAGQAMLRLANVSTLTGPVTLVLDGTVLVADVAPETLSDYFQIPDGTTKLTLRNADQTYIITLNPTLAEGSFNTLSLTDSPDGLAFEVVPDADLQRVANRAKFRFFNATANVGPVRVVAVGDTTFEVVGLTAPGFGSNSGDLAVTDFNHVRRIELRNVNDVPIAVFTDARQITMEMIAAFNSWDPTQGVVATFYLVGTTGPGTVDLSIIGAVDDPQAGGLSIVGDGQLPPP